jgi:hypothetical protein
MATGNEGAHRAERGQPAHDAHREHRSDHPREQGPTTGVRAVQALVDLVARQQEDEPETDVRQGLDVGRSGHGQQLWTDDHPADQQQHDLRHAQPRQEAEQQRREHGDDRHREQGGHQLSGAVHTTSPRRSGTPRNEITGEPACRLPPTGS